VEIRLLETAKDDDVEEQPEARVTVLAIGKKLRNRVVIGDEEIEI
jgi:hypothetical protein